MHIHFDELFLMMISSLLLQLCDFFAWLFLMTNSNFAHFMPDENEETNQYISWKISITIVDYDLIRCMIKSLCLFLFFVSAPEEHIFPYQPKLINSSPFWKKIPDFKEKVKCTLQFNSQQHTALCIHFNVPLSQISRVFIRIFIAPSSSRFFIT